MSTNKKVQEDIAAVRAMVSGEAVTEPQDKKAKILFRVRALLAQADDEQAKNPGAADSYRAKANTLMMEYAIEQWQVDAANDKEAQKPKPEVRYMDFNWFYRSQFESDLYSMFHSVARHCRCVVAVRGHGYNGSYRQIPVIGLPSDLDWFDLLFTNLMLQMGRELEPKPDTSLSFGENAYRLRASGMARPRIAKLLYEAGIIPGVQTEGGGYVQDGKQILYEYLAPNKEKSLRARVRVAGEKWGSENGYDPTTTVNPKVWQRSFSRGFVYEIGSRLRYMRQQTEGTVSSDKSESTALALRDIFQMALDLYNEMFPPPEPVEVSSHGSSQRRRRVAMERVPKYSDRGMSAGRKAAAKANISGHPSKGIGGRKEIGQ